jgi:hypothetical protein
MNTVPLSARNPQAGTAGQGAAGVRDVLLSEFLSNASFFSVHIVSMHLLSAFPLNDLFFSALFFSMER